jgi:hypothetical protein
MEASPEFPIPFLKIYRKKTGMKGYIASAVAVILIAASLPYGYQISRRQVLPTLST